MFGPSVSNLQNAVQKGFLERAFVEPLNPLLVFRRCASKESFSGRIGESITKTKTGLIVPNTLPLNPSTNTNLDNGMTPQSYSVEQYSLSIQQIPQLSNDINLIDDEVSIASFFIQNAKKLGVAQGTAIDTFCRNTLLNAYMGGHSCITLAYASGVTSIKVDDIRGFTQVSVAGIMVPVSVSNPLSVAIGAYNYGVTGAIADGSNVSAASASGGISGTLTITPGLQAAVTQFDAIDSFYAAPIIRPNGRSATNKILAGDFLTLSLVRGGVATFRNNGIPVNSDGYYHMYLDATSMNQLRSDPEFQLIIRGRGTSDEDVKLGWIDPVDQVRYFQTTQSPIQTLGNGLVVHRPMLTGGGALIESVFERGEQAMASMMPRIGQFSDVPALQNMYIGYNLITPRALEVADVSNMWLYIRPSLDRLGQIVSLASNYIGGFVAPTDVLITPSVIGTSSSAYYKRAIVFETA